MTQKRKSEPRAPARRFAIFNHKGGVGKTTLTVNTAFALVEKGKRVLLVDSDPQCNLTSYLIEDSVVDKMLDESDTAAGKTLWSAIKPIAETTGDLIDIEPIEHENDLYILPGDIQLAQFETLLGDMWGDCFQSRVRGLRGVTALSLVVNRVCNKLKIDYVFYDSGPNIGPLNRAILLDCDHFIIPAACDLFSIRALKTLGKTLSEWIKGWVVIDQLAPDGVYLLHGRPKLLGYIPQRFRVYSGLVSSQYQKYFARLEKQVFSDVAAVLQLTDPALAPRAATKMNLGAIKDFSSLVNAAQQEGVPLWRVTGGAAYLRGEADSAFAALAQKIITAVDGG